MFRVRSKVLLLLEVINSVIILFKTNMILQWVTRELAVINYKYTRK